MRILLFKPLYFKKQSNLLKIGFEKLSQKINSFDFILDVIFILSKINKRVVVSAEKNILLLSFIKETRKNSSTKNSSTKKIIYSF